MAAGRLSGLSRGRLRKILALFFLLLLIPTAILIQQAHRQLKWESFRSFQVRAVELVGRIDDRLLAWIAEEEARPEADYGFLVAESGGTDFFQRSPLSRFPVVGAVPGLIGHFQVDAAGGFSTPLLPVGAPAGEAAARNMAPGEREKRAAVEARIRSVLRDNRLVTTRKRETPRDGKMLAEEESFLDAPASGRDQAAAKTPAREPDPPASMGSSMEMASNEPPQAAFDRLRAPAKARAAKEKKPIAGGLGRVEELKLQQSFRPAEVLDTRGMEEDERVRQAEEPRRVSGGQPPQPGEAASPTVADAELMRPARITTFEGAVDSFDFRRLDSGEFVVFRNAWRDGQRFIQGVLIAEGPFLASLVRAAFRDSSLSVVSDLIVAHRGDIIDIIDGASSRDYLPGADELRGELLHQGRLSAPFSDLELIFTVTRLPAGPGATLIFWLSAVLLILLSGGFYLLYRLGGRQIDLARQQQDFVSAVSHELKTPLTSIRMYGELLREGWVPEEKRRGYYDYIHDESERLSRLIGNVLQLARMTRNELRLECVPVGVDELMNDIRSRSASQIESAGFRLDLQCDPSAAGSLAEVDRDSFSQVIINLVDNAIKFSRDAKKRRIDIACRRDGEERVVFSVRDYGPGIARDQMKKIFDLFYRGENELTRETIGTGIGLALVSQLVQAMGGRVQVVNREPGAEFLVTLPCRRDADVG